MAGMRAASRGATPNPRAEPLLRACLDLVEHLVRQSLDVTAAEVETTLAVLERAFADLEGGADSETAMNPASVALKNAIGRLKGLKLELGAK
jgi:allophanate hydrolase subunit 2